MKIAVIVFPGSNCDVDLYEALGTVCGADVAYVSHHEHSLAGFDAVMLPGGFSYGDYLRAGAIARFTNIMPAIIRMAEEGKPVFGTCNGFQILTEAGLLPGALKRNDSQRSSTTGPCSRVSTGRTNGSACRSRTPTVAFTPIRKRWTAWRPITRSSSVMQRRIQMVVCEILLELLTSVATFWE